MKLAKNWGVLIVLSLLIVASLWPILPARNIDYAHQPKEFRTTTLVLDGEVYLVTTDTRTSAVKIHRVEKFGQGEPYEYMVHMFPKHIYKSLE
jgi:hypothetical protein